jgi:hypothetical protein
MIRAIARLFSPECPPARLPRARSEARTPRHRRRTSRARSDHRGCARSGSSHLIRATARTALGCSSAVMERGGHCAGGRRGAYISSLPREASTQQRVRFHVRPPEKSAIAAFALSPDGRYLAFSTGDPYSGVQGATSKLWLRPNSVEARRLGSSPGGRPDCNHPVGNVRSLK